MKPWVWLAAGGLGIFLVARGARAGAPTKPFVEPEPGDEPAPPPGPLAVRLTKLLQGLDEQEIESVQQVMPPHFWDAVVAATMQPSDPLFTLAMQPMSIDVRLWGEPRWRTFQADLVGAIGMLNALELQGILQDGNVI